MKDVLGSRSARRRPARRRRRCRRASARLNTNRKQVDALTRWPRTATSCHETYINPPGFAMEAFNAAGTWQTTESFSGAAIDTSADVVVEGSTDRTR